MGDPRRYSHRRPRYYDDDDESDTSDRDNYPPPKPSRRSHRSDPRDNDLPPPPAPMPAPPPPPPASMPPPPAGMPNQQTSDDDDYNDRRRSNRDRAPPPPRDLEAKTGDGHRKFRQKRDGYESDEGENLRRAKKSSAPKPRGYPDDDDYGAPLRQERSLPLRGKPRDPVEYGGDPVAAGDSGALRRRRTYKDPSSRDRDRQGYDDYDASPRRGPERRRTEAYDDPGYRSDHIRRGPSRRDPPRRRDYDDSDDYGRPPPRPRPRDDDRGYRSGGDRRPRPQDYYSDHREDRAPRRGDPRRYPSERDRYGGDRDRDRYDDRRRSYYDDPYSRDPRGDPRRKSQGGGGWQKEAGAAIMAYAMPTIKKEGTKWAKKELSKFLAARGAGGA